MSGEPEVTTRTTIVIPTIGRPSLGILLEALAKQEDTLTVPVIVVDDRADATDRPLSPSELDPTRTLDLRVLTTGGRGPAGARNLGWRHTRTPWVTFLDDDVVTPPEWAGLLATDLVTAERGGYVGSQARILVPRPDGRRPTDDEQGTIGLETSAFITADMSYRRSALVDVGGFDERFRRAFREDSDIALRLGADRDLIAQGERATMHPVKHGDLWFSVRQQQGNADDRLMRRLHGRGWRRRARAPLGRLPQQIAITGAGAVALASSAKRGRLFRTAAIAWTVGTAEFAWARIAPGPRTADEVRRMALTSIVIPPIATWHTLTGLVRYRTAPPWLGVPDLVLFDRDGTLIHDIPYNGDPDLVSTVDGARDALDRLRDEGIRIAIVTNQSAIGTGRLTAEQVAGVNARVEELLGPFDGVYVCPHAPDAGCGCRKPAPGLVATACHELGVPPDRCVVVGDIGSDVGAATAAGAGAFLVPTAHTMPAEVMAARRDGVLVPDLTAAVDRILGGRW